MLINLILLAFDRARVKSTQKEESSSTNDTVVIRHTTKSGLATDRYDHERHEIVPGNLRLRKQRI